jgi:hypothetical protein
MEFSHAWPQLICEVTATVLCYRFLVSPMIKWSARQLGAGQYPAKALNGTYPETRTTVGATSRVCLLVLPMTVTDILIDPANGGMIGIVPKAALGVLLWKHVTLDYDAASKLSWQRLDRGIALVAGVLALVFSPFALLAVIFLCGRFGAWTHHSSASVRVVKASFSWSVSAGAFNLFSASLWRPEETADLTIILGTVYLSHYVIAFRSKVRLGSKPWSWATENRVDILVASAYAWGWAGFLNENTIKKILRRLAPAATWLNWGTLLIEGAGIAAFSFRWLVFAAVVGAVCFNIVVAITSGIFFLENMVVGVTFAVVIARLHTSTDLAAFGLIPWFVSAALLALTMQGWGWRPTELGWWDTPLTERVHWKAVTRDGKVVGINNDFMSPFDREYARTAGRALVSEPIVTYPLGGVENSELRDRLLVPDLTSSDLCKIREQFGVSYWNPVAKDLYLKYMSRLFAQLNAGKPKSPLPRVFRWLKAPTGHLYYWSDLPRYQLAQGPVVIVQAWYREILYLRELQEWVCLQDKILFEIDISGSRQ